MPRYTLYPTKGKPTVVEPKEGETGLAFKCRVIKCRRIEMMMAAKGREVYFDEEAMVRPDTPPPNPYSFSLVPFQLVGNILLVEHTGDSDSDDDE